MLYTFHTPQLVGLAEILAQHHTARPTPDCATLTVLLDDGSVCNVHNLLWSLQLGPSTDCDIKLLHLQNVLRLHSQCYRYLGESLRALLVLEVRQLKVTAQKPTQRVPAHLSPGCTAVCFEFSTPNGAIAQVVLGGPLEGTPEVPCHNVYADLQFPC